MDVSEFQHAIKLGLGRAILHLQNHDAAPYRDIILQVCLKNTIIDYQIEGDKSYYLMQLVYLTGEKLFYHQHILNAASWINSETDDYDAEHLLDMTAFLAARGNYKARQILYDVFSNYISPNKIWWSTRIIRLDKFEGLLFVLNILNQMTLNSSQLSEVVGILNVAEEIIGKDEYESKLGQTRESDLRLDKFLNALDIAKKEHKNHYKKLFEKSESTYEELQYKLFESRVGYLYWDTHADQEHLLQAAHSLLEEKEVELIKQYLQLFRRKPFPLEPKLLFPFVYHSDSQNAPVAVQTLRVLKNIQHSSVREFALKLIVENHFAGSAVGLLNLNFEDGDWQLIESITKRTLEDMDYHSLQLSVRHIFEKHPLKDAAPALLNLYEYGVCSFCREFVVEALYSIDALSDTIREECLYDSNLGIRALAKRNFEPETQ